MVDGSSLVKSCLNMVLLTASCSSWLSVSKNSRISTFIANALQRFAITRMKTEDMQSISLEVLLLEASISTEH